MEIENKSEYKFYKKKNKAIMVSYIAFSIAFLVQLIDRVIDRKYISGVILGIITVIYAVVVISAIKQQKNISKTPGLIIDEQYIKFQTNISSKYKVINLKEITSMEVPKYDEIITINTSSKKYLIILEEYEEKFRAEIKDIFRTVSKKVKS
jgi:hypothetical protein